MLGFYFGMENILNKINEIEIKLKIAENENDKNRIERLETLLIEYNIEKNHLIKGKEDFILFLFLFCLFVCFVCF